MPSASELLVSLGLKKKKPAEATAAAGVTPAAPEMPAAGTLLVVPAETPALESAPAITSEPTATETPSPTLEPVVAAPAGGLPDWLSAPSPAEPTPAPMPDSAVTPAATPDWLKGGSATLAPLLEPEAPVVESPAVELPVVPSAELHAPVAPAAETPVASPAVEAEKSPEQLAIEQFEEALLAADNALGWLRAGETLDNNQLRAAKAAAATANGSIRNLPERYLRVLLASRRLGENRDYNRLDFQKDMMAAIRVFSQANKG